MPTTPPHDYGTTGARGNDGNSSRPLPQGKTISGDWRSGAVHPLAIGRPCPRSGPQIGPSVTEGRSGRLVRGRGSPFTVARPLFTGPHGSPLADGHARVTTTRQLCSIGS